MRSPIVARRQRGVLIFELSRHRREVDCRFPRGSAHGARPVCGHCFACGLSSGVAMLEAGASVVH